MGLQLLFCLSDVRPGIPGVYEGGHITAPRNLWHNEAILFTILNHEDFDFNWRQLDKF